MQNFMERLRPLVGLKSWDYCVLWILSEDQRFIEWVDCCCSGADEDNNNGGGGGGEVFHVSSSNVGCRDTMFQHPKTKACDLLFQLPSSLPLDSGNRAETLFSNQYRWLNFSNSTSDSSAKEETIGTRVLIPITGGLVELYVAKQVAEDQNVIDFIKTQCSIISLGHEQEAAAMINSNNTNMDISQLQSDHHELPLSPTTTASQNPNHHLPYDISVDRIHLCSSNNTSSSPMNFPQQLISFSSSINNQTARNGFFYEGGGSNRLFQGNHMDALQNSMITDTSNLHHNNNNLNIMDHHQPMISNDGQEQEAGNDEKADSVKQETGASDSDCSDQADDNDGNTKYRRRNGKAPPAKNLMAERKRRKKLQDRLYALRALVPKITKLDKAAILGDAIDFVQELQKQAKDLQDELEENSGDESDVKNSAVGGLIHHENNHDNINNVHHQSEFLNQQNGGVHLHLGASDNNPSSKQNHHDSNTTNDKGQQMEPQVEVAQLDGNEFFVKVFCEHKAGGFVRLLEALNTLGLEVTNANVTSFLSLVSNVFVVEKRDSGMVGADHVRDSLLELTRNPKRTHHCPEDNPWKNSDNPTTTPNAMDYHHHHHHHLHNHNHNHNHHIGSYHHHHLQN